MGKKGRSALFTPREYAKTLKSPQSLVFDALVERKSLTLREIKGYINRVYDINFKTCTIEKAIDGLNLLYIDGVVLEKGRYRLNKDNDLVKTVLEED